MASDTNNIPMIKKEEQNSTQKQKHGKVRRVARNRVVKGMAAGASVGGLIGLGALPFAPVALPGRLLDLTSYLCISAHSLSLQFALS